MHKLLDKTVQELHQSRVHSIIYSAASPMFTHGYHIVAIVVVIVSLWVGGHIIHVHFTVTYTQIYK